VTADSPSFGAGVESTLGIADAPSLELRDRVLKALGYTISWAKAVAGGLSNTFTNGADSDVLTGLAGRVSDMQTALQALLVLIPVDSVFPGKDAAARYEEISAAFAQLYRDLVFNAATLPQPGLLDTASGLASAVFDAPAAAVTSLAEMIANAIARALGGAAAAIWRALWPFLLAGGAVGVVYVFRAPLGRLVGKVTK